jgi:PAS domain S-box-containing protein
LFGYTADEAAGRHITLIAPGELASQPNDHLRRALDGERIEQVETERVGKDGAKRQVLISLTAIRDEGGRPAGAVAAYRDLTEQRRAERALLERWDGAGYPAAIEQHAIPLVGRIVAVVDAFDAMTHDRPYRPARPIEQALAELQRCSGAQFDPTVVAAFMTLDHSALVERF